MRILMIHRYFWPDTPPYASMLRVYGTAWVSDGHHVDVFTSQPSYKRKLRNKKRATAETIDGINVHRCTLLDESRGGMALRLTNMVLFLLQLSWFIVKRPRYSVVVMSTVPQVVGAWVASVFSSMKKSRFIYHMQDIHPEGAQITGVLRNSVVGKVLRYMDAQTCHRAHRIVVLSDDMKATLLAREKSLEDKIRVIKNPVVQGFSDRAEIPDDMLKADGVFRVVFAGNIGRWQALDRVVDVGKLLKDTSGIEIVLLGEGASKDALVQRAQTGGNNNIRFFGHQPVNVADKIVKDADLALITLAPGMYKVAFPSKIMTYCLAGVPVLAMIESHSELAKIIAEKEIGYSVEMDDVEALASVIREASKNPVSVSKLGKNAKGFGDVAFDEQMILSTWDKMMDAQPA